MIRFRSGEDAREDREVSELESSSRSPRRVAHVAALRRVIYEY